MFTIILGMLASPTKTKQNMIQHGETGEFSRRNPGVFATY
jgi:hypothetical protein